MAKFSDLFGRKAGETGPGRAGGSSGNGNGNGHQHISVESFSDTGSRLGEANEALRNLLSDTGRKIGELDDLKDAFEKIVAPFNNTLRALEQEKSQSLSLSNMLAEARNAYDTLRSEFYQVEKKAIALESEIEKLREDLELARESAPQPREHAPRADRRGQRPQRADRRDRAPAGAGKRAAPFADRRPRILEEQFDISEKRNIELDSELAGAREKLALLEDEKRSLQAAVDQRAQRSRPPHPPPDRKREQPHRHPRPTRQGRGELCRGLRRTRPPRRGARPNPRNSIRPTTTA